ncbi:Coenzyme F420 hydrogenase/dehydrogenase, beta subunit C-terminal domain [Lacrimispora sp.]|uniref:Coenzyme F420 hydrogenase/dehydrogenase, beta subunit C-terminal domain n=1 Tax=Lacrimispora sp. TaxID=2719234 RepID=UPI002FDA4A5A
MADNSHQFDMPLVFAVKHKELAIRMSSRSGGVFTALSDYVLEEDGVVYGCILSDDFKAVHVRAENANERNRMRGSKYIQSDLRDVFKAVKADLECGRKVLFSGTSCQVAGLRSFIQKYYEGLFCTDILCHGVPSPKVWEEYLAWQEKKNSGKCTAVDFRNKAEHGWEAHIETLTFINRKKVHSEVFKTLFYGHAILRPSCYKCPYKNVIHPGDITIADYWGIDKAKPGFNDNKGVSLVLINNNLGESVFKAVKGNIDYKECSIEDSMQPVLVKPFDEPVERVHFWSDFYKKDFEYVSKKYGGYGLENNNEKQKAEILSPDFFVFPYEKVKSGKRICIYGAGNVGENYYVQLNQNRDYQITGWFDSNYKKYSSIGFPILSADQIDENDFDYIIIAVRNKTAAEEIRAIISQKGISDEKIIWDIIVDK